MKYFDTHAHYDWKEFDKNRNELFDKFKEKLCGLVNIGINLKSIDKVKEYSEKYEFMYYSVGIHPMEVSKDISIKDLDCKIQKNNDNKLVAIGETGLDYHFNYPIDLQKEYFIKHIELANKYNLPIIIHSRESHNDVLRILTEHKVNKAGIVHCYSGKPEMVKSFLDLGYYIGVGGPITRYQDIQESVMITPINRIVLETDAPVLPPKPFEKHDINNSIYLKYIISKIAEIKCITEDEVIKKTTKNAFEIYNIS